MLIYDFFKKRKLVLFLFITIFLLSILITFSFSIYSVCNNIEHQLELPIKGMVKVEMQNRQQIDYSDAAAIEKSFGIIDGMCISAKLKASSSSVSPISINELPSDNLGNNFTIYGISSFSYYSDFIFSSRTILQGDIPSEKDMSRGNAVAVIDSDFASLNNLSVGDSFSMSFNENIYDISTGSFEKRTLEKTFTICGIYTSNILPSGIEANTTDISNNMIFIPYSTMQNIWSVLSKQSNSMFKLLLSTDSLCYRLTNPAYSQLESKLDEIFQSKTTVISFDEQRQQENSAILSLLSLLKIVIVALIISSAAIYIIVCKYITMCSAHDFFVKRALGFPHNYILKGYIFPVLSITCLSCILSSVITCFFSSRIVSDMLISFTKFYRSNVSFSTSSESVSSMFNSVAQISVADTSFVYIFIPVVCLFTALFIFFATTLIAHQALLKGNMSINFS